jgi:hypothetical protein
MTGHTLPPAPIEGEPEPESFVYVPVLRSPERRWRARVGGSVGLVLLVVVAALVVALATYELGHLLSQVAKRFLHQ